MRQFIIYDSSGKIPRTGQCSNDMLSAQAGKNEFVMKGTANGATQKVEFDGFDEEGQPINPRVVDKTPEEVEMDSPALPEIPFEKQTAYITNEQWLDVLKRLDILESK